MVDLLIQLAPEVTIIVFFTNPDTSEVPFLMKPYILEAASAHGRIVTDLFIRSVEEIGPAVDTIAAAPGIGIILPPNNWVHNNSPWFVEAINRHRLPAVYPALRMVDAGGILGVGIDTTQAFRMGGQYAGRILGGLNPAELPVQAPPFSTAMNLRTATAYGMTVPLNLLVAVDRFIE